MKTFKSILLPWHFEPGPSPAVKLALWFATQLKSRVFLVCFGTVPDSDEELFESLGLSNAHGAITVRRAHGDLTEEILRDCEELSASLIMSQSESAQDSSAILDSETQRIIEQAPVPVLLVPEKYEEHLPWRSILVPMSGETRPNPALKLAIDLANAFQIKVDVIHLVDGTTLGVEDSAAVSQVSDQVHHEYPERIDSFISEASPFSTDAEKGAIRSVSLVRGEISEEISKEIERTAPNLIAVRWKGQFMEGHAETLKQLIRESTCPLLLVKPSPSPAFTLKLGKPLSLSPPDFQRKGAHHA